MVRGSDNTDAGQGTFVTCTDDAWLASTRDGTTAVSCAYDGLGISIRKKRFPWHVNQLFQQARRRVSSLTQAATTKPANRAAAACGCAKVRVDVIWTQNQSAERGSRMRTSWQNIGKILGRAGLAISALAAVLSTIIWCRCAGELSEGVIVRRIHEAPSLTCQYGLHAVRGELLGLSIMARVDDTSNLRALEYYRDHSPPPSEPWAAVDLGMRQYDFLGFGWAHGSEGSWPGYGIRTPLWFWTLVFSVAPALRMRVLLRCWNRRRCG